MSRSAKNSDRRPILPKVSEEMRHWSALLLSEVSSWPDVRSRRMFGMTALYRREKIFAALPATRALNDSSSFSFKLPSSSRRLRSKRPDQRVYIGRDWHDFSVGSAEDLRAALEWLTIAYECAGTGIRDVKIASQASGPTRRNPANPARSGRKQR